MVKSHTERIPKCSTGVDTKTILSRDGYLSSPSARRLFSYSHPEILLVDVAPIDPPHPPPPPILITGNDARFCVTVLVFFIIFTSMVLSLLLTLAPSSSSSSSHSHAQEFNMLIPFTPFARLAHRLAL